MTQREKKRQSWTFPQFTGSAQMIWSGIRSPQAHPGTTSWRKHELQYDADNAAAELLQISNSTQNEI